MNSKSIGMPSLGGMASLNNSMHLLKKFLFYFFGFSLGCLLVFFYFRGKKFPSIFPGDVIREEISSQPLRFTSKARCQMQYLRISEEEIIKLLSEGDIDFTKSRVHATPCPVYLFSSSYSGRKFYLLVRKCGNGTDVIYIRESGKKDDCVM